jgi:hypothetical protein
MKKVVVFCSASDIIDPKYNEAAREMARGLHAKGYSLVSGGGKIGTMGAITDESIKCGGDHTAVLPKFMKGLENPGVSRIVWTDTMSTRKEAMREGAVAAIALPGGIGTMDELIETHVLKKLHKWNGEIYVLNIDGFYNPVKALLEHYVKTGMMEAYDRDLVKFPESVRELLEQF